jgi:uncharacterized membrane protein YqjE
MNARDTAAPAAGGLLASLRAIGATLGELAGTRGSLFAIELREEIERRERMLALAALCVACFHAAFLLLAAFVVLVFWETHRIAAVGAMAALCLAGGVAALLALRRRIAHSPAPFAATLGEFQRDLEQWRAPA